METGFQNLNLGGRIRYLYTESGIDCSVRGWATPVATDFFDREIIAYKDTGSGQGVRLNQQRQRDNVKTQLAKHVFLSSVDQISTVWIQRYCRFFGCSAAYLFGEIEQPTIEQTDICKATGLAPSAVKTLIQDRKAATIDKQLREALTGDTAPAAAYNLLADTVSFLLRPEHCEPGKGGLLHLIGHYIVSDDLHPSSDLPEVLQTENFNGSGLRFDTAEVIRAAIPNMVMMRLNEYRAERLRNRKKPT